MERLVRVLFGSEAGVHNATPGVRVCAGIQTVRSISLSVERRQPSVGGPRVEARIGKKRFAATTMDGGCAALLHPSAV